VTPQPVTRVRWWIPLLGLALGWLAALASCASTTALKEECFDIVTGLQIVCTPGLECRIWSAVQADGTQSCWGGQ
jgi:hypothetical protein